jgi:predicted NodU family carbamoyl transferase
VINGKLACGIEEERIRRIKPWARLTTECIKWFLKYAGIEIDDIAYIDVSKNPFFEINCM